MQKHARQEQEKLPRFLARPRTSRLQGLRAAGHAGTRGYSEAGTRQAESCGPVNSFEGREGGTHGRPTEQLCLWSGVDMLGFCRRGGGLAECARPASALWSGSGSPSAGGNLCWSARSPSWTLIGSCFRSLRGLAAGQLHAQVARVLVARVLRVRGLAQGWKAARTRGPRPGNSAGGFPGLRLGCIRVARLTPKPKRGGPQWELAGAPLRMQGCGLQQPWLAGMCPDHAPTCQAEVAFHCAATGGGCVDWWPTHPQLKGEGAGRPHATKAQKTSCRWPAQWLRRGGGP